MTRRRDPVREALRTVEASNGKDIRRHVLDQLRPVAEVDFAASFDLRATGSGYHFVNVAAAAPSDLSFWADAIEGVRWPDSGTWDPRFPDRRQLGRFVGLQHAGTLDRPEARRVWDAMYAPIGITDQARALLYHQGEFIGFVGLSKRGGAFGERQLRRLSACHDALVAAYVTAKRADVPLGEPADLVLGPDGTIEHASEPCVGWLDADRRAWLAQCVTELDLGREVERPVAHGVRARFVRLYGASGVRYLAHLDALPKVTVSPLAALSPRQREIAGYAAVGATNREIAVTTGMSEETVHSHLRQIYARLRVASRLELAEALRSG